MTTSRLSPDDLASIDAIVAAAPPLTTSEQALLKSHFGPAMAKVAADIKASGEQHDNATEAAA